MADSIGIYRNFMIGGDFLVFSGVLGCARGCTAPPFSLTAGGNLGMVATLFYQGGQTVGAVGIVGPRRMPFGQVVPVVKCIGETLTSFLASGQNG